MKKRIIYLIAITLLAASCASDDIHNENNTLSGDGIKTPIGATALLDAGGASTRAANKDFDNEDKLLAYLRHVKWDGSTGARTLVSVQNSPMLVSFTKGSTDMTPYSGTDITPIGTGAALGLTSSNTKQTADLTADPVLYWDDFSVGGKGDDTDIRTAGHYLQSYYGYCFNGGDGTDNSNGATVKDHITAALNQSEGTLGWNVSDNQTDATNFQNSDLLWSAEQTPVAYNHAEGPTPTYSHGTLLLPYTHAMSKVTIHVTVRNGFANDYSLSNATGTLKDQFVSCTCTAPTNSITSKDGNQDIQMKPTVPSEIKKVDFEAIIVPAVLSVGNNFAIISTDADTYQIPVTQNMITNWTKTINGIKTLTETDERVIDGVAQARPLKTPERGKGYAMVSGVNYVLNVTIDKQDVTVSATIRNWIDVEAEGEAKIQFAGDVTEKGTIAEELRAKGLDIYKSNSKTDFAAKSTTLTWSAYANEWIYDPAIYWAGQGDDSYFRALSPKGTTTNLTQGNDILWGTSGDEAIKPRTGDVPLEFEHAMTKITFQLETSDVDAAKVNFDGATLSLSHLAKTGTIDIKTGDITAATAVEDAYSKTHTATSSVLHTLTIVDGEFFIPQAIGNDARLKLTLADGTTYSLQLNTCYVNDNDDDNDNNVKIGEWKRGKHYTYTIHVEKEAITFRALIKDWDEKNGSGNATLEWD